MMRPITTFILLIISWSILNGQAIKLPSKIFAFDMLQPSHVYIDGKTIDFYTSRITEKHQNFYGWLNKKDIIIMKELSQDNFGHKFYDNLYLVDIHNNIVDTVFLADISKGERIRGAYISPNDSILLIHLQYNPPIKNYDSVFYSPFDILVMDFKSRKIIERIDNFYAYIIHYSQSMSFIFSPSGKQFVYSISDRINFNFVEKYQNQMPGKKENGIYIYNLETKEHQKIADGGADPIWSPDGNTIAYFERNEVWFYDLRTKEKTLFYNTMGRISVVKISWTPDGDNLYILTRKETRLHPRGILTHRLINIKDKSEIINGDLMKLGITFFWKE